jgi:phage shock protein C
MTSQTDDQPPTRSEAQRLYRSRRDRQLAGVCAGVAEYLGGDPTVVRLVTVVLGLFTGIFPMLILYVVAAVVIPERPAGLAPQPATSGVSRPGQGTLVLGAVLIAVGVLGLLNTIWRVNWDLLWPVGVIAFGVLIVFTAMVRR